MLENSLAPQLMTRFFPRIDRRVREALLVFTGSLFVAGMAQVRLPLPFTPVPITGQTFAVLLVGAALGARLGVLSLALYLVEGLAGLPFFAGGASGLTALFGPTGGYLVGFVAAAYLVGLLAERGGDRRVRTAVPIFLAGEAVIYLFGLPWLGFFVGFRQALALGLFPFLVGDVLKLAAAALALPAAWRLSRHLRH